MKETQIFLNETLKNKDIIVVGCSGGPDSMCLLHVINSLKNKLNLKVICAHVNHGLRIESNDEAEFVKKYCKKNNIIFEYMIIEKYKNDEFTENEGREKRYEFFNKLMNKYQANILMTAHHGDDLIETILMRIVRGSNLKGYIGINSIKDNGDYKIIRPLLNMNKNEIIEYLKKEKVDYVLDKSNDNEKYTRNRYRKQVLPFLKQEDNFVHKKFLKFSEELEKYNKYIRSVVLNKISKIYKNNYILIDNLIKEEEFIQDRIIEFVIEDIQKKELFNISDNQFSEIKKLIHDKQNKQINLSDGFIARKSYNKIYIEKHINNREYMYEFSNNLSILNRFKFEYLIDSQEKNNYLIRLNSKEIKLPLIIRNKRIGDKMEIKNLNGSKKIKDIFIDCKIDKQKRNIYPIITDSENRIIWIPGIKKSKFDKEINEKYDIIIKYTEEKYE